MSVRDESTIFVVDDEVSLREGVACLLRSVGYGVRCFASADEFLTSVRTQEPSCLLLDVRMPGKSGLDLQTFLRQQRDCIPIIFLTGHGDVPLSVRAMKYGAIDFLLKPFHEQTLLDAVRSGIERDKELKAASATSAQFEALRRTLTPRENEVLMFVVEGLANKEIAARLSLKEITIKVHRAAGMRKLRCKSVAELVTKVKGAIHEPALLATARPLS